MDKEIRPAAEQKHYVQRIGRELKYKGNILDVYEDLILTPDGKTARWDFIGHKGAAAVVAVTDEGKLVMVRQYRNALDRETIELPAGARDYVGEPTMECAIRELKEETGYTAGKMEYLMTLRTTIAYCDELIDVYLATQLSRGEQHLDDDEVITVHEFDLETLCSMVFEGTLQDAKTVAGIMAYRAKLSRDAS